jgi:hypothetical protein
VILDRLFHYKRFVESHLISLLCEGKVKLSRPDNFNDPWDCRVHYQAPTSKADHFIIKSQDWSYKAEWRLLAGERGDAQSTLTIKTDNDFLTLPSGVLKSVTIGSLADEPSRRRIKQLVETHGTDVLVRQATLASDRYEIRISPPFL